MSRKPDAAESWWQKAIELMIRQGLSLRHAVAEMAIDGLTTEDCNKIEKRKLFQEMLWAERNKYHAELANMPGRNKTQAIGIMVQALQELLKEGQWEKVLDGVVKLSKLEGWIGAETTVNVLAGLSQRDIDEARAKLTEQQKNASLPN